MFKRLIVSGSYIEYISYEKDPKKNIPSVRKVQKRVYNPFKQRRVDNLCFWPLLQTE